MRGMVLVVVGVFIVGLATVQFAIPSNKPIAFPVAVATPERVQTAPAVVKLARARTAHAAPRARGGHASQINP